MASPLRGGQRISRLRKGRELMAIDAFMAFKQYPASGGAWLGSESQVNLSNNNETLMNTPTKLSQGTIFEIKDYSFDIAQTLNIGSHASGAGAGKVTFNPFSVTRRTDRASPLLFQMACAGTPFETVVLLLRRSAGAPAAAAGLIFLRFDFKLVAVKSIAYAYDGEAPKEQVTFEYAGLQVRYAQQTPNGAPGAVTQGGWNRVKNAADTGAQPIL
jgi:type VI secretion system secreted protein Hcp